MILLGERDHGRISRPFVAGLKEDRQLSRSVRWWASFVLFSNADLEDREPFLLLLPNVGRVTLLPFQSVQLSYQLPRVDRTSLCEFFWNGDA